MLLNTLILLLPSLCYLVGALSPARLGWPLARACAGLALLASLAAAGLALWQPLDPPAWVAGQPLNLIMSVLISLLGLVVVRYSAAYLAGDSAQQHYRVWLQACLASVSLVVISDHLLLLVLAWSSISVCMHQLLMSYPDRFRAVLAAHKKFIFARLAELCLMTAALLLWQHHDTFVISEILARYPAPDTLGLSEQAAAFLFACAALIKCAQLPVHGWLMQVVEAPTPVSALLHAGVINLGGYLLLLMAPLMASAPAAQWLLLVVAGLTSVLAALIMMTRISIKVRLAWSTSAQMGLMLVECALGLHELAVLHLLAHSCYKAHAFLNSGNAVHSHIDRQLTSTAPPVLTCWLRNLVICLLLVSTLVLALPVAVSPADLSMWLLVAVALSLWLPLNRSQPLLPALAMAVVLLLAYAGLKSSFALLLPASPDAGWAAASWTAALALLLLAGHGLLVMHRTALAYRWRQWLFAGLYLDEWVTRTTLRLWPVDLPANAARKPGQTDTSRSEPHERLA